MCTCVILFSDRIRKCIPVKNESQTMRYLELPGGEPIPTLGLGTWFMGESASQFAREVDAVRYALERGIRLIDTAEMYANGGAEDVVGAALAGFGAVPRDDVFIVSKVLPNCSIPDDHISPRRSALFMARSVLRDFRDGGRQC